MHELARHGAGERGVGGGPSAPLAAACGARVGGHERERRAEPFAARTDEVGRDLGEERIGCLHRFPQRGVDPEEVVGERGQVAGQFRGPGGRSGSPGPVMCPR